MPLSNSIDSAMDTSNTEKIGVYSIAELEERILRYALADALFRCNKYAMCSHELREMMFAVRRVNRDWSEIIKDSPSIQKAMFLAPEHHETPGMIVQNPILLGYSSTECQYVEQPIQFEFADVCCAT